MGLIKSLFSGFIYFLPIWIPGLIIGAFSSYFLALGPIIILLFISIAIVGLTWNLPYGSGFYKALFIGFFLGSLITAMFVGTIAIPHILIPSVDWKWSWFFSQ